MCFFYKLSALLSFFLILLNVGNCIAQDYSKSIKSAIELKYQEYFKQDRKSIHLHINKSTYATGERIWFSAYVFNRKKNRYSLDSEYIYINLLNSKGAVLETKTIRYDNGAGFGEFLLDAEMASGNYYLQAYTNEMNDFIEDESSTNKIEVINFESLLVPSVSNTSSKITIKIQPEGGQFIDNVFSSAAIRITDTSGKAIVPDSIYLKSSGSSKKSYFKIDTLGLGKISIIPKKNIEQSVIAFLNNTEYRKSLPKAKATGYNLALDHSFIKKKILLTISSNKETPKRKLNLYIHKDGRIISVPLTKKSTHEIAIGYETMFPGINTITLFDNDSIPIAERLVFIPPNFKKLSPQLLNITATEDSLTVLIKNNGFKEIIHNTSISVVPENRVSESFIKNIQTSFLLGNIGTDESIHVLSQIPFLDSNEANFQLDKFLLLMGNGKYNWDNILNKKIPSDNTIHQSSIEGYANLFKAKNDSLTVMLYSSVNGLFEYTQLGKDSKFKFNELALANGSKFTLTLLNNKGKPVYGNFFFVEKPVLKPYNKVFKPRNDSLIAIETQESLFKKVEMLEEVVVQESYLKREKLLGGSYNGQKIDSTLMGMTTLGSFMKSKGLEMRLVPANYLDPKRAGTVQLSRINELNFPSIVLDGVYSAYAMDYANVLMKDLDEIYYRKNGRKDAGLFIAFSKKPFRRRTLLESEKNSKDFIVKNGYDVPKPFRRSSYYNLFGSEFKKYGVISWFSKVNTTDNGLLSLKIPNDNQDRIKLRFEGFGENNTYLSDDLIIDLKN